MRAGSAMGAAFAVWARPKTIMTAPAIQATAVVKHYGTGERRFTALNGVDLSIQQGEFFGLLGPNGAGKTSLISIIAGLNRPSSGSVSVMGHDVVEQFRPARAALGVVPQELVFDPFFTVRETLRNQSGYYGIRANDAWIDELLANLDLTSKADSNMRSLSGGMKRRVLVAQALVHKPPVIVLDEPTAGVDVELRQGLWKFIRRLNSEGHTIVLTTHYLEEAQELCDRIAMLKAGQVVALDKTANLLKSFSGGRVGFRIVSGELPTALRAREVTPAAKGKTFLRIASHQEMEGILTQLRLGQCQIDDLELSNTDLEDVFVNIMNGKLPQ
jgi:ABC-2 type transport system ATP-binding protein